MPPRDPETAPRVMVAMSDSHGNKRLSDGRKIRSRKHGLAVASNGSDIPWRTSKRLQEATLRLLQERDAGNLNVDTVAKIADVDVPRSTALAAARFQKGIRKKGEKVSTKDPNVVSTSASDQEIGMSADERNLMETGACQAIRKPFQRKRGSEETSERPPPSLDARNEGKDEHKSKKTAVKILQNNISAPLLAVSKSEDNEETGGPSSTLRALASIVDPVTASFVGSNSSSLSGKHPQSSFDLLCSNKGHRGWRCYRSRVPGELFCIQHQREIPCSAAHSK